MYSSAQTQGWFRQRNLVRPEAIDALSAEATAYLLVTLAVRPDHLPVEVKALLADRYLGHCMGDRREN